jgi:hypothetical protein
MCLYIDPVQTPVSSTFTSVEPIPKKAFGALANSNCEAQLLFFLIIATREGHK